MKENIITLETIYYLTCVLLNKKISKEVWVSPEVMAKFIPTLEQSMKQGMKVFFKEQDPRPMETTIMFAGFTLIEKPEIKGIMCFGNDSFALNEKDSTIEDFLTIGGFGVRVGGYGK